MKGKRKEYIERQKKIIEALNRRLLEAWATGNESQLAETIDALGSQEKNHHLVYQRYPELSQPCTDVVEAIFPRHYAG